MIPTNAVLAEVAELIANDATQLADPAFVEVILSQASFNPLPTTVVGDLVLATFDGYAAKAVTVAVAQWFQDPATGEYIIQLNEPVGGWHWETTGTTNLPQTIYGFGVTDPAGTDLWGSGLLDTPIVLTAANQGIDIPQIRLRLSNSALS